MKTQCIRAAILSMLYSTSFTLYANTTSWKIDPAGSKVTFVTEGKGGINAYFNKFRGTASFEPHHIKTLKIDLEIDANSLSAGLKTPFYKGKKGLNVSKYPKLTFTSTRVEQLTEHQYKLHGILNMHGVSKAMAWNMTMAAKDRKNKSMIIYADTQIDRRQWGMNNFNNMIDPMIKLDVRTKLIAN